MHWIPAFDFCNVCQTDFTHIVKMETYARDQVSPYHFEDHEILDIWKIYVMLGLFDKPLGPQLQFSGAQSCESNSWKENWNTC